MQTLKVCQGPGVVQLAGLVIDTDSGEEMGLVMEPMACSLTDAL